MWQEWNLFAYHKRCPSMALNEGGEILSSQTCSLWKSVMGIGDSGKGKKVAAGAVSP